MQKWEYLVVYIDYHPSDYRADEGAKIISNNEEVLSKVEYADCLNYLDELGGDGWELVSVYQDKRENEVFHFKRLLE